MLFVRLTPKAARDSVDGIVKSADERSYIMARVRAVPEKGAANKALEKLLAKTLKLPASSIEVVAGGTSRLKQIMLTGDTQTFIEKLNDLLNHGKVS